MKYLDVLTTDFYSNLISQQPLILLVSHMARSCGVFFFLGGGGAVLRFEIAQVMPSSSERHTPLPQPSWISHTKHSPFPTNPSSAGRSSPSWHSGPSLTLHNESFPPISGRKSKQTCWTQPWAPELVTGHGSIRSRTELLVNFKVTGVQSYCGQLSQGCFLSSKYRWCCPNLHAFQTSFQRITFTYYTKVCVFNKKPRKQPCQRIPKSQPSGKEGGEVM